MAEEQKRRGGLHAGHRKRVRQKFLDNGLEVFADHEVLELLLFYAVPRRDVNEMAHRLLDRFGSLPAVLDAPEGELCTIPGVGPHIAHFLNLIPEVMVQMSRQGHSEDAPLPLRTPKDLERVMETRCPECPLGHVLLILTDANCAVVSIHPCGPFEELSIRELAARAVSARAAMAVLVERVADCTALPSPERLRFLDELARGMDTLGVPLRDHYTVDFLGHTPHSYARSGQLLPR